MPDFDTTPEGIRELARKGESSTVEFKIQLPPADIIGRELASFANTEGGILLIGVADNGEITGIPGEAVRDAIDRLHKVSSSMLPYPTEISCAEIEGKSVVYAVVAKSPKHYGPVLSSRGEAYERQDSATVMLPGSALKGMIRGAAEKVVTKNQQTPKRETSMVMFVAMSFREEEDPALADYFSAIKRAAKATELNIAIRRMDLVEGDFEISQQLMEEIDNADVVLADFTLNARNVYFELGYARGRNRRVIQAARKGTTLEFDIRNWRTLFYRNATELEEKLQPELSKAYSEWQSAQMNG
jgi:predicted HTH transcriptional regulator